MANGDIASAEGFTPVAPAADFRLGYDDINRLADFLVSRIKPVSGALGKPISGTGEVIPTTLNRVRKRVICTFWLSFGSTPAPGSTIAQLPTGFRPIAQYETAGVAHNSSGDGYIGFRISDTGTIAVLGTAVAGWGSCSVGLAFDCP